MVEHFQMLARYNRLANERVFEACAGLASGEFECQRFGSFGSIQRTLNHILLSDQVWMSRFVGAPSSIARVDGVPFPELADLRAARQGEDERIAAYAGGLTPETIGSVLTYKNLAGVEWRDPMYMLLGHMFNHQTHHRGQAHVMLSQAGVTGLSLDIHRLVRPL
jgi:uncharacterized damage-inducible protein DinB